MTAVTTAQTPPNDLLLSLLTGMVGGQSEAAFPGAIGEGGDFVGLLESLEGENFSAEELATSAGEKTASDVSSDGQLYSLITASLSNAGPTKSVNTQSATEVEINEASSSFAPGGAGANAIRLQSPAANPGLSQQKSLDLPAMTRSPNGLPVEYLSQSNVEGRISRVSGAEQEPQSPIKSIAPNPEDSRQELTAAELPKFDFTAQEQGIAVSDNAELATQGGAATTAGERGMRGTSTRDSRSRTTDGEGSWQWELNASSSALPQSATAVTAVSTEIQSRNDDRQASLAELGESPEAESAHHRPETKSFESVQLSTSDLNKLAESSTDFESHLDEIAESFPLDSVASQIATAAEPDAGWISIEIHPPELGKLEIMVSKQGDDYLARIVAHEAATSDALSLQREQLIEALGHHGLELKEIQITSDTGSSGSSTAEGSRSDAGEHQERENLGDQNERNDRSQRTNFSLPTAKADFHHSVNGLTGNRQVNLLV